MARLLFTGELLDNTINDLETLPPDPKNRKMSKNTFLNELKPSLEKALSYGYNYSQLAKLISQKTNNKITPNDIKKIVASTNQKQTIDSSTKTQNPATQKKEKKSVTKNSNKSSNPPQKELQPDIVTTEDTPPITT
jgi:hypothetical protein